MSRPILAASGMHAIGAVFGASSRGAGNTYPSRFAPWLIGAAVARV